MKQSDLINIAKNACKNAYAPLTGYTVGAALLTKSGTVYIGVNVEDEKIPNLSICAERNAIQNAYAHGDKEIIAIAVVGKRKDAEDFDTTLTPCGICLQYIVDMCKDVDIICYVSGKEICNKVEYYLNTPFDLSEKIEIIKSHEHIIVLGDRMNHKQLLALFLCFVMILSTKIVSIENNKAVAVKEVTNNIDKYTIENIVEEKNNYNINIFYPVTKCEEVNNKINEKIKQYKEEFEKSDYISDKKELLISFEEFEYKEYTSFKFNIKSNIGVTHSINETFTVVYKGDNLIEFDDLFIDDDELMDEFCNECQTRLKENQNIKKYSTEKRIEDTIVKNAEVYSNFILSNEGIIVVFNPDVIAPFVAGIIQIEIPYETLGIIIE